MLIFRICSRICFRLQLGHCQIIRNFKPTKCSNLHISRQRISPYRSYNINGIDVEVVSTEKDLGVVFVNDTSWKNHILTIVAKANRLLGFIRRSCAGIVGSVALLRCCVFTVH